MKYSIGDVSRILDVKPHVIRYWEEEIPFIAPQKTRTGRRVYSERDLQMLQRLRHLLYDQRFTLEGARRRLWDELRPEKADIKARIAAVRAELLGILNRMRGQGGGE